MAPWKSIWRFLENLKIELPYDPDLSLLGIYSENSISYRKDIYTHAHISFCFTHNSQELELV